jgi:cation:H+ antiporter
VAASIRPIRVNMSEVSIALAFGLAALIIPFPDRQGLISRRRGVILLVLYALYLTAVIIKGAG